MEAGVTRGVVLAACAVVCVMEEESSCDKTMRGVRGGRAVPTMLSWESETARIGHAAQRVDGNSEPLMWKGSKLNAS